MHLPIAPKGWHLQANMQKEVFYLSADFPHVVLVHHNDGIIYLADFLLITIAVGPDLNLRMKIRVIDLDLGVEL